MFQVKKQNENHHSEHISESMMTETEMAMTKITHNDYYLSISAEEYLQRLTPILVGDLLEPEEQPLSAFLDDKSDDKLKMLQCTICLDYFSGPVIIHACGQMFCAAHFDLEARFSGEDRVGMEQCGLCNKPFVYPHVAIPLVLLSDLLSELQNKCKNCQKVLKRKDFEHHIFQECKEFQCSVSNECSAKNLTYEAVVEHVILHCEFKEIECLGRPYGCPEHGFLRDYFKHYVNCDGVATHKRRSNDKEFNELMNLKKNQNKEEKTKLSCFLGWF